MSFADFIKSDGAKAASLAHRVMVYGPPKIGKTAACALLAKHFEVYLIDGERGGAVIANPELGLENYWGKIQYFPISDSHELPLFAETTIKLADAAHKKLEMQVCKAHGKAGNCPKCGKEADAYQIFDFFSAPSKEKILVVDSSTQLGNSVLAYAMQARGKKSVTEKAEFDDWGAQGKWLNYIFTTFQGLDLNIIVISHDSEVEQEDGTKKLSPTAGTKNFSSQVARYFGHLVYAKKTLAVGHTGVSSTLASLQIQIGSRTGAKVEEFNVPGESLLLPIFAPELAKKLQAEWEVKKKALKK